MGSDQTYKCKKGWDRRQYGGVLTQFTEEEINNRMANIIARNKVSVSGQCLWNDQDTIIRRQFILDLIARGWSNTAIDSYVMEHWKCSITSAKNYRKDACKQLVETNEEVIESNRQKQVERLEKMVKECQDQGKYKEAAMLMEQISKLQGLYIDRSEVVIKDYQTKFDFAKDE